MNKPVRLFPVLTILCGILLTVQVSFARGPLDEKRLTFTVPGAPWNMTLPAGDFVLAEKQEKPDGSGAYFYLSSEQSGLYVSFYIEPVSQCKDSKACRDMVRKQGNPAWEQPQNFISSQIGEVSYFEFLVPSFRGMPVKQLNMYAEFVVDGFWVDLHISKILYEPRNHVLFEALVKAIKFEPKEEKARG